MHRHQKIRRRTLSGRRIVDEVVQGRLDDVPEWSHSLLGLDHLEHVSDDVFDALVQVSVESGVAERRQQRQRVGNRNFGSTYLRCVVAHRWIAMLP